jgi:type IV pilus assembly protein PilB
MAKPLLGEMLVENGVITREQMNKALEIQQTEGGLMGIILVSDGIISEQKLVEYLAMQAKIVTNSE